jgi:hypothetical protein
MAINYQDIASAAMGGTASQTAPTFQQASWNTMKNLGWNEYNRNQERRNWARTESDFNRGFEDLAKALPGQYNRKGMLDSGVYQAGANRAVTDHLRNYDRSFQDYNQRMDRSRLMDDIMLGDLSNLRNQLNTQDYQSLVASMVKNSGGVA